MDTRMSVDRLRAIMAAMGEMGTATFAQISEATNISQRAVPRYVFHLCETRRLELLVQHNPSRRIAAVYSLPGEDVNDIAPAAAREFPERQWHASQRRVGANDWPRGEHARRSGLLAYFYPLAQG